MALRVLLADESTSIKKVLQLALQDFGVEVKAVPIGIDVLPVAKSWVPDLVFCDVLLAKKSGYDVSLEIKNDPQLGKIPVVLMWSGFMDIDESRAVASRADRRLEKPFDAETLRGMVKDLVPFTKTNVLSDYLTFPRLPEIEDTPKKPDHPASESKNVMANPTPPVQTQAPSMTAPSQPEFILAQEVDEPEDFTQVPLPKNPLIKSPESQTSKGVKPLMTTGLDLSGWSTDNLDRFKIHIPTDDYHEESLEDLKDSAIELTGMGEVALSQIDEGSKGGTAPRQNPPTPGPKLSQNPVGASSLDPVALEDMVREQIRHVLTDIAWKIIPDVTERIVREELQKLLKDAEKLS